MTRYSITANDSEIQDVITQYLRAIESRLEPHRYEHVQPMLTLKQLKDFIQSDDAPYSPLTPREQKAIAEIEAVSEQHEKLIKIITDYIFRETGYWINYPSTDVDTSTAEHDSEMSSRSSWTLTAV